MQRRDRRRHLAFACKPVRHQSRIGLECQSNLTPKSDVWELTDELVDLKTDLVEKSRRFIIIVTLGRSLSFLLEGLFDVESLGCELLGLSSIMSDKDVVDFTLDLA